MENTLTLYVRYLAKPGCRAGLLYTSDAADE